MPGSSSQDPVVVKAPVELDAASAPEIRNQVTLLLVLRVAAVTIDLERTTFVDSSGIGTLVALTKRAAEANVAFRITGVQPRIHETLRVNGLHRVLPIDG